MSTIQESIRQLIGETQERRLSWTRSTPTSFVALKPVAGGIHAQLSLQKTTQTRMQVGTVGRPTRITVDNYVFQLTEMPGQARLVVNTQLPHYQDLRPDFADLFDTISEDADREGIDFLKRVIES